ncbi:MAG: phosphoglycerate kinase [Anaerolineales bacterium]
MRKKSVRDLPWTDRRALIRVDFNVPLRGGEVADDSRLRAALPTIRFLRERAGPLTLLSHLGRPKGKPDAALSLRPIAVVLGRLLESEVQFIPHVAGPEAEAAVRAAKPGQVTLLENTRFDPGETRNDPALASQFARLGDVFVNDAFGSAHRAHASTVGVAGLLPAVAGLLLEREIRFLSLALEAPEHPYIAILGGAKVSDKIGVIRRLMTVVDRFLMGGGMANTFLAAQGLDLKESLVEASSIETASELLKVGRERFVLPIDVIAAESLEAGSRTQAVPVDRIPSGWRAVDIGPKTRLAFRDAVQGAKLIVWNGPVGVFEIPAFSEGTRDVALAVADSQATTIVGGGDSAAAVNNLGIADRFSHVSTGGGASLEFLEGRDLPGIAVLEDA